VKVQLQKTSRVREAIANGRLSDMNETEIISLIRLAKTIGVVGMQDEAHADRPAFAIPKQLAQRGYELFPINPKIQESLGRPSLASLSELPVRVDILDVFRRAEHIPALTAEILALPSDKRPRAVWLQSGITEPESEAKLTAAGMTVVSDRCLGVYAAYASRT
jgi:predicted CoA-binding protein